MKRRNLVPRRILRDIDAEQARSERLIGWAQLLLVLLFAALYLASPRAFAADAPFAPAPYAIGFYLGFTLLRLWLAYRASLPAWVVALSIVIDLTLLFGLIWSFHIQYDQPPPFYLKAPTLLYVFIFIALRALRFEARYVLLTGAAAALGWAAMVAWAIMGMDIDNAVTRDYVTYMYAPRVLIGAEVDKIVSILVVTVILGVAIRRGRAVLERAMIDRAAAGDLARFFPPEVVRRIVSSEERLIPGEGELREATILFCDIRGFSRRAMTIGPDAVMRLLGNYERRVVRAVHAHGGAIDKFMGDGVMATFGAVAADDAHARRALDAAAALLAEMDAWNARRAARGAWRVSVGVGLATGPVIVGAVGSGDRLEYTVIGSAVNLAAKLEKHTRVVDWRALASGETLRRAREQGWDGVVRSVDLQPIAGIAGPVAVAALA